MIEGILIAAITTIGAIIVALVQKGRRENKDDHNVVATLLVNVKDDIINLHHKIDHVDQSLDGHIDWHMKKKEN